MSAHRLVVVFDDDITRRKHVKLVCGGLSRSDSSYARVTIHPGARPDSKVWAEEMCYAIRLLKAILPAKVVADPHFVGASIVPMKVPEVWQTVAGYASPGAPPAPPADPPPVWSPPARTGQVQEIYQKVAKYAGEYGSHPDFGAGSKQGRLKVHNYIVSTYGSPLPEDVVEQVAALLAQNATK